MDRRCTCNQALNISHNDTYKGLGRTEDIFSDSCIRLYPYLLIVSVVNMKSGYTSEYNRIQHDIGRGSNGESYTLILTPSDSIDYPERHIDW